MGRTARVNLPGAPFHLIARLQDGKPLFLGSEEEVMATLSRCVGESDVRLLAYALMSNHLHLVVVQGRRPLSHFMQQLLRCIALHVQRQHGVKGHAFQGRYRAYPCLSARHLRAVLCYVHLNPVRAGLCREAGEYRWTSHGAYCGLSHPATDIRVEVGTGLQLFASRQDAGLSGLRNSYLRYLAWRSKVDELEKRLDREEYEWVDRPTADLGDDVWQTDFARSASPVPARGRRPDLEQIAKNVIAAGYRGLSLDDVRSGARGSVVRKARNTTIERALAAGYANHQIARYLRISPSVVSRVASSLRARNANGQT